MKKQEFSDFENRIYIFTDNKKNRISKVLIQGYKMVKG